MRIDQRTTSLLLCLLMAGCGLRTHQADVATPVLGVDTVRVIRPEVAREAAGLPAHTEPQLLSRVHFAFDSDEVSEADRLALGQTVQVLLARPEITLRVEGHTDGRGSDVYNTLLSRRRVRAVLHVLVDAGLPPERIQAYAYGRFVPRATGEDEIVHASNRRVEIYYQYH